MAAQKLLFDVMALVTFTLQGAIVIGMYKKRLTREFHIFFAYTFATLLFDASQFFIRDYFGYLSSEYFIAYWLGFPVQMTLLFFVIKEVYANVLYRYEGLKKLSSMIFQWAFMLLVTLAIINFVTSPAADRDLMYSNILKINHGIRIVEFGLIVLLFVFAKTLALGWHDCVFGIAVGTCFYCSTELVTTSLRTHYGRNAAELVAVLTPVVGILTLAIWTTYIFRGERVRAASGTPGNVQLEDWNRAVMEFLGR